MISLYWMKMIKFLFFAIAMTASAALLHAIVKSITEQKITKDVKIDSTVALFFWNMVYWFSFYPPH